MAADGFTSLAWRLARWAQSLAASSEEAAAEPHSAIAIGVTSCSTAEGVTATVGSLAEAAANVFAGGVFVIASPRETSPSVERNGALCRSSPSAAGADPAHGPVASREGPANGHKTATPLLERPRRRASVTDEFWTELESLRTVYGLILVDLPPAGESMSVAALAGRLDGMLLVVEAERTPSRLVQQVKERLESGGAKLLGVVLNKAREHLPPWLDARLP